MTSTIQTEKNLAMKSLQASIVRISRYMVIRLVTLFLTVVVGVYLTIMIANMGGHVDRIMKFEITERITQDVNRNPANRNMSTDVKKKLIADRIASEENRLGLNEPFPLRVIGYMTDALTLNLGRAQNMSSLSGSRQVQIILLERLPSTLILFATSNILIFFITMFAGLSLSRRYGSFLDKAVVALSPISSAPGWFFGIFLIVIFAAYFKAMPFGGMVSSPPPENPLEYFLSMLEHMILPVSALTLSSFFASVYGNRTFFLIYSSEDYVEMAKAKGLTDRDVENRYVLRPTLPSIIASFAFLLISSWTGAPIFEAIFQWPGLGRVTVEAIGLSDTPVIVASTVLFAYMLAATVFMLDFIYALVDPRVKIGGRGGEGR